MCNFCCCMTSGSKWFCSSVTYIRLMEGSTTQARYSLCKYKTCCTHGKQQRWLQMECTAHLITHQQTAQGRTTSAQDGRLSATPINRYTYLQLAIACNLAHSCARWVTHGRETQHSCTRLCLRAQKHELQQHVPASCCAAMAKRPSTATADRTPYST